ncbi:MAG TPA: hypothetical protein VFB40_02875 [Actinocrinis sp.]|nr:hypothetical protein [Actinocrinis sp.]HZP50082.1 hypothetical protein [Actinocrinis sp.]
MKAKVHVIGAQGTGKRRRRAGLLAVGGALALASVAACGTSTGTSGTGSGVQGGFRSAAQTGGALTVWVDSTRLAAAQRLGTLLDDVPQFNPTVGSLAVQRPELALATLLAITPVLLVFLFSQRFLVAGMLAGATKE